MHANGHVGSPRRSVALPIPRIDLTLGVRKRLPFDRMYRRIENMTSKPPRKSPIARKARMSVDPPAVRIESPGSASVLEAAALVVVVDMSFLLSEERTHN